MNELFDYNEVRILMISKVSSPSALLITVMSTDRLFTVTLLLSIDELRELIDALFSAL